MPQPIKEPAWQFRHSVQCHAPRQFAWSYWTNIANWNDPSAKFALDGPFDVGSSRLTTTLPGQTWHSIIRDRKADREATIEMQLPDAILSFHWQFEELPENRTRIAHPTRMCILSDHREPKDSSPASLFSTPVYHSGNRSQDTAPKGHFFRSLFSTAYTLFQVPYPVTPLLACPPWRATATKIRFS